MYVAVLVDDVVIGSFSSLDLSSHASFWINPQRIAWWSDRLSSTSSAPPAMTLVPVTVRAATSPAATTLAGAALSLVIGGDLRIDVVDASRVPPLWLAAVVDAISRRTA